MSLPKHSRNPPNGHSCCWKPAVFTLSLFWKLAVFTLSLFCVLSFALSSTPLFKAIRSWLSWEALSHHQGSAPGSSEYENEQRVWASHVCGSWRTVSEVMEGKEAPEKIGVGGRPFKFRWWQENCYGAHLEVPQVRNGFTALVSNPLCDLGWALNSPQKNGVISYQVAKRSIIPNIKPCIKKKSETKGRKEKGGCGGEEVTRFMKSNFSRLVWAQFQEEVLVIKTNNC